MFGVQPAVMSNLSRGAAAAERYQFAHQPLSVTRMQRKCNYSTVNFCVTLHAVLMTFQRWFTKAFCCCESSSIHRIIVCIVIVTVKQAQRGLQGFVNTARNIYPVASMRSSLARTVNVIESRTCRTELCYVEIGDKTAQMTKTLNSLDSSMRVRGEEAQRCHGE